MRSMMTGLCIMAIVYAGFFVGTSAFGHCEIPCGIYGDRMRIDMLKEHADTVEKSMKQIKTLQADPEKNANQLVRWVVNKDEHANKIQEIVYQYFMNQRVSPVEEDDKDAYVNYVTQITLLHRMLVSAMKCKQTLDEQHVAQLRKLIDTFADAYFTEEDRQHKH